MPTVSADDRGRIYLPKDLRQTFGEKFRVVKLESGVKLIPVDEDPVEGLKKAMNADELEMEELSEKVEEKARNEIKGEFK